MKRPTTFVLALLLLFGGNLAAWAQAPRAQVGLMEVDGKNAFYNQTKVKNHAKVPIYDGDYISTGPGTSVRVNLMADGYSGFIQLDENTDPNLIIAAKCIVMKMLKGQALVNAKNICLGTQSISGVTRSTVNLKADGMASELTVVEGGVDLDRPIALSVGTYERYQVAADGAINQYTVDAAEAARSIAWSKKYFGGGSSSGKKAVGIAAAVLGAILVGKAIDDHNDTDKDPPTPWCCIYTPDRHEVLQLPAQQCQAQQGQSHPTKQAADDDCQPSD
ncbi:hypothetical protein MNR01_04755 [Lysobacter sp. S4-A87]|uniref:hypothetical protein n=1 Tax=Lysobacter sp. S4-A87 TaxID=2925843 RepID=UPI001F52DAE2|nr:hypothetical protein [Lysobacter sp. S4-A87]UNK50344.1 hypothetical protein MNR01_04755 [Lysobacter sp. S4-A87]